MTALTDCATATEADDELLVSLLTLRRLLPRTRSPLLGRSTRQWRAAAEQSKSHSVAGKVESEAWRTIAFYAFQGRKW